MSQVLPTPSDAYARARELLRDEVVRLEAKLSEILASQAAYLSEAELAFYGRGKRLRPILLLLSARAAAGPSITVLEDRVIAAAVSLEIIHVASLIHDDIVDKAPTRRGLPTIHASRGYEMAMLIGDLQFIEATRLFSSFLKAESDLVLLRRFLDAGQKLCRGQIDEMLAEPSSSLDALVLRYYRTVDRKTGQLTAFACEAGARLVDGSARTIGNLRRFGVLLGRAFQVMDDVLDVVQPSDLAGKEALTDLAQGRLSLPLIYTLQELPSDHLVHRVMRGETRDPGDLVDAARAVRRSNGWVRAYADARMITLKAACLLELIPASPYRQALLDLTTHLVDQDLTG